MNRSIANRIFYIAVMVFLILLAMQQAYTFRYGVTGDERSYVQFSFSSIRDILSNYRTFGFPLIISIYRLFFGDNYYFWPSVTVAAFIGSALYFKASLSHLVTNPTLVSFATIFLLCGGVNLEFNALATEPTAVIFVILSISALIRFAVLGKMVDAIVLLVTTFFAYQVRPALISFPFSYLVFWGALHLLKIDNRVSKPKLATIFLVTVGPLFLFMLLRFIVVGSFGLVAFTGFQLSGHAAYYLDENSLPRLNVENVQLAKETLRRRNLMGKYGDVSCNAPIVLRSLSRKDIKDRYLTEYGCFGVLADTAWFSALGLYGGPTTPDGLVSGDYVEIDRRMLNFAVDVIRVNFRKYLEWVVLSTSSFVYMYVYRPLFMDHVLLVTACVISVAFVLFLRTLVSPNTESGLVRFNDGDFRFCILYAPLFSSIYFLLSAVPLIVVAHPAERYIDLADFFIGPALSLAYIGLLFWLLKAKDTGKRTDGSSGLLGSLPRDEESRRAGVKSPDLLSTCPELGHIYNVGEMTT